MLTLDQINTIHQLHAEGWSLRRIERHLHICLRSVRKYLAAPEQKPSRQPRASKLDSFKPLIDEFFQQDSAVTAAVILQRLRAGL